MRKSGAPGALVGIVHTGKIREKAGAGLGIEPLSITRSANLDRVDTWISMNPPYASTISRTWRRAFSWGDGCTDGDTTAPGNEARDITDAQNIKVPVLPRKSELAGQVTAYNVAIKEHHGPGSILVQLGQQGIRDR